MNPDVAATDALLAVAGLGAGLASLRGGIPQRMAGVGLALVGLAAVAGTFRYGGVQGLEGVHTDISALAAFVGVPVAGLSLAAGQLAQPWSRWLVWATGLVPLLAALGADLPATATVLGAVGMVAALVVCASQRRWGGAIGALLVMVAGLVIVGDWTFLGLERLAWFHVVLAVAIGLLGRTNRALSASGG